MKTLVIGAAIIDIIMKIKRLPKSGEDILCSETVSAVGGCVFFPKHAPNPRASVISVNDTNPADAFFRSMYLHIDCPFCLLCVFSMHIYLYDSARMP